MPQAIAEIEGALAIVARQQRVVLVEIGNVADLDAESALIEPGHVVRGIEFDLAEALGKRDLLFVADALVVKHQHRMAIHAGMDRRDGRGIKRPAQVDVLDLAGKCVGDRLDPHRALRPPCPSASMRERIGPQLEIHHQRARQRGRCLARRARRCRVDALDVHRRAIA